MRPCTWVFIASCLFGMSAQAEDTKALNPNAWAVLYTFNHSETPNVAILSPDGSKLVTGSDNKPLRVWDANTGEKIASLEHAIHPVFSPDGRKIVAADENVNISIWDAKTGKKLLTLPHGAAVEVLVLGFSPDGNKIVAITEDVRISGNPTSAPAADAADSTEPEPAADAAIPYDGRSITVWDAQTGKPLFTLHSGAISPIASFSPDSNNLITVSYDSAIYSHVATVWDIKTGKKRLTLQLDIREGSQASFSSDGSRIVTTNSGNATIWNAENGTKLRTFQHAEDVKIASLSPDGEKLVTVSSGNVIVWDVRKGTRLFTLEASGYSDTVAFLPEGNQIITSGSSYSYSVPTLWDATTGKQLFAFQRCERHGIYEDKGGILSLDGNKALTICEDSVFLWKRCNNGDCKAIEYAAQNPHGSPLSSNYYEDKNTRLVLASNGYYMFQLAMGIAGRGYNYYTYGKWNNEKDGTCLKEIRLPGIFLSGSKKKADISPIHLIGGPATPYKLMAFQFPDVEKERSAAYGSAAAPAPAPAPAASAPSSVDANAPPPNSPADAPQHILGGEFIRLLPSNNPSVSRQEMFSDPNAMTISADDGQAIAIRPDYQYLYALVSQPDKDKNIYQVSLYRFDLPSEFNEYMLTITGNKPPPSSDIDFMAILMPSIPGHPACTAFLTDEYMSRIYPSGETMPKGHDATTGKTFEALYAPQTLKNSIGEEFDGIPPARAENFSLTPAEMDARLPDDTRFDQLSASPSPAEFIADQIKATGKSSLPDWLLGEGHPHNSLRGNAE